MAEKEPAIINASLTTHAPVSSIEFQYDAGRDTIILAEIRGDSW